MREIPQLVIVEKTSAITLDKPLYVVDDYFLDKLSRLNDKCLAEFKKHNRLNIIKPAE